MGLCPGGGTLKAGQPSTTTWDAVNERVRFVAGDWWADFLRFVQFGAGIDLEELCGNDIERPDDPTLGQVVNPLGNVDYWTSWVKYLCWGLFCDCGAPSG